VLYAWLIMLLVGILFSLVVVENIYSDRILSVCLGVIETVVI